MSTICFKIVKPNGYCIGFEGLFFV